MPGTSSSFRFGNTNVADGLLSADDGTTTGGLTSPAWIWHGRDWKAGGDTGSATASPQSARKGGSGTSGKSPGRGSPPLSLLSQNGFDRMGALSQCVRSALLLDLFLLGIIHI